MFKNSLENIFPFVHRLYDLSELILVGSDIESWLNILQKTNVEKVHYINQSSMDYRSDSLPKNWEVFAKIFDSEDGETTFYELTNNVLNGTVNTEILAKLWKNLETLNITKREAITLKSFLKKACRPNSSKMLVIDTFDGLSILNDLKSLDIDVLAIRVIIDEGEEFDFVSQTNIEKQFTKWGYKNIAIYEDNHPKIKTAVYTKDVKRQTREYEEKINSVRQNAQKTLTTTVEAKEQELTKIKSDLETKNKEIQVNSEKLQKQTTELENKTKILEENLQQITSVKEASQKELAEIKKQLENKTKELTIVIEEKEQELTQLKSELEEKEKLISALIQKRDSLVSEKDKLIENFGKDIEGYKHSLKLMELKNNYYIMPTYISRQTYTHFSDQENEDEWQLEVYLHALGLIKKHNLSKVIDIGCGSGYKLINYLSDYKTIGYELEENLDFLKEKYPDRKWKKSNFQSKKYLKSDLIICSDVIEHLVDPDELLTFLQKASFKYLVLSTPDRSLLYDKSENLYNGPPRNLAHVREWTFEEFYRYIENFFTIVEHKVTNTKQATQMIICTKKDNG